MVSLVFPIPADRERGYGKVLVIHFGSSLVHGLASLLISRSFTITVFKENRSVKKVISIQICLLLFHDCVYFIFTNHFIILHILFVAIR